MGLIEDFIAEHPKEMELAQMRRREVKKLLADYDKTLREQIAREIESSQPTWNGILLHAKNVHAAIARGEK